MLKWFKRKKDEPRQEPQAPEEAVLTGSPDEEAAPGEAVQAAPAPVIIAEVIPELAPEPEIEPGPEIEPEPEPEPEPEIEPEPEEIPGEAPEEIPEEIPAAKKPGLFARLRNRLGKTKSALVDTVMSVVRLHGKVDEELFEEIEEILIKSDVGVNTTMKIVDRMRKEARRQGSIAPEAVIGLFKDSIREIICNNNRPLDMAAHKPMILLLVGVNGTGKTTTIGKIARTLSGEGKRVMMVAADTFRAAAADQLAIWAERTGSCIVRREEGADPAAVVFEALEGARQDEPDVIMIDTAGRLHTKLNLMEQLKKIVRVIQKHYPDAPHETILVLDATTGQNALNQVRMFNETCELSGLIMTKLDGTAKGGVLIACKDASPLPIFKIGIGESAEDLRDFDAEEFVGALFGNGNGNGGSNPDEG